MSRNTRPAPRIELLDSATPLSHLERIALASGGREIISGWEVRARNGSTFMRYKVRRTEAALIDRPVNMHDVIGNQSA
jgi:hypothetical protein